MQIRSDISLKYPQKMNGDSIPYGNRFKGDNKYNALDFNSLAVVEFSIRKILIFKFI